MVSKVFLTWFAVILMAFGSTQLSAQISFTGQDELDLEERVSTNCWSFYPNPVTDILFLNVTEDDWKVMRIEILDPIGRIIEEIILDRPEAVTLEIDLGGVPNGMYFIRVFKDEDSVEVERIHVSH